MIEMKYLILSMENWCIFTYTPRAISASAMAAGDGDSVVKGITFGNCVDYGKISNRDMFYSNIYMMEQKTNKLVIVPDDQVSDSWKQQREILRLRQDAIFLWETYTANSLVRVVRHAWQHFDVVAEAELSKCDPTADQFTHIIEEYARIMELPVNRAYKELKLRIESDNVARFRIQAMAEKWKNKINQSNTADEINKVKQEMLNEFWLNSYI